MLFFLRFDIQRENKTETKKKNNCLKKRILTVKWNLVTIISVFFFVLLKNKNLPFFFNSILFLSDKTKRLQKKTESCSPPFFSVWCLKKKSIVKQKHGYVVTSFFLFVCLFAKTHILLRWNKENLRFFLGVHSSIFFFFFLILFTDHTVDWRWTNVFKHLNTTYFF